MPDHPEPPAAEAMNRRAFLGLGAMSGALLSVCGCGAASAQTLAPVEAAAPAPFELEEATIARLQEGMRSGRYTARRIAELYLERIEALDRQGPTLRHVIETNPDALAIADALDAEREAGRMRGPMHGIPVLLKDNIDTADRMQTTAGSLALVGRPAPQDAFLVERLRAAGAVILGKANLSEWANFRSTRSSSGWSARGGQGRNPYALDRSPCGSSSGSGGAVAASYAAVAVGTETDGSIVCPASGNGLVGVKPTLGLVSRTGVIPIAHSQDTAGPMARTVTDAAILLGALTGADPRDAATAASVPHVQADYTRFLDADGLRGARIGVARGTFFGYNPDVDRLAEAAVQAMRDAGAVVVDPVEVPHLGEYGDSEYEVLLYEFKADLNAYLASRGDTIPVKTLADLIAFNEAHAAEEMPYFGQEIFHQAQAKGPLTEPAYLDALERNRRLSGPEGINAVMDEHELDALVMPTGSPMWPIDLLNGDHFTGGSSSLAAVSGYPSITVPMGHIHGLPVGLTLTGRAWSEPVLLRLAYAYEQATRHRRPPQFLPTADLSAG